MSVLIYIDTVDGSIKKSAQEALTYGADLARQIGTDAAAVIVGQSNEDLSQLGKYGVKKVYQLNSEIVEASTADSVAAAVASLATSINATVLVFSHNLAGKATAPLLSAKLKAGLVSGVVALPDTASGFNVKRSVFSGKAFAWVSINTAVKILAINPNSYHIKNDGANAEVIKSDITLAPSKVKLTRSQKASGELSLTEAETVVSAGRGMKGPENWGLVEDLAKSLGAATACSRPVADAHWRPHNEHVGQTGIAIAPNLYVAIGISGAIQHLAGVNRSKVIVVINKDPEAPFFKAADYGIVGDAFEILPQFTAAVKKLKAN